MPLFWTSGDVCPGFQSQDGSLICMFRDLYATEFSVSTLARHLPTLTASMEVTTNGLFSGLKQNKVGK